MEQLLFTQTIIQSGFVLSAKNDPTFNKPASRSLTVNAWHLKQQKCNHSPQSSWIRISLEIYIYIKKVFGFQPTTIRMGLITCLSGKKHRSWSLLHISSGICSLNLTIRYGRYRLRMIFRKQIWILSCIICKIPVTFPKRRLLPGGVELIHYFEKYHFKVYKNIL